ncbi:unnamed protein product [Sphenostylis stenocarpa]|uniref:Thioesterase domain-containing protein n=1 Tax=Sphenostylis stenocarpa TaxID=92480 RepID=A0AA86SR68_9FABA|nr:unnamed protein product [Sphenostylis stenocarpa]
MGSEKNGSLCASPWLKISKEVDPADASATLSFLEALGAAAPVLPNWNARGAYDALFRNFIKLRHIQPGRISISILAKPCLSNGYGTLHGGSVGTLAEILSTACARTVVAEDKELFLGEMSISYMSATPANHYSTSVAQFISIRPGDCFGSEEVLATASVVKSGRNLTVVAAEFKLKKNGNVAYNTRATFYNMPLARL